MRECERVRDSKYILKIVQYFLRSLVAMQVIYQVRDHCAHCFEIKVDNIGNPTTMQIVFAFRDIISFLSVNFHIEIAAD